MLKRICVTDATNGRLNVEEACATSKEQGEKESRIPENKNINGTGSWVYANDTLSALLWCCIVRAQLRTAKEQEKLSSMMYAIDIRGLLSSILSKICAEGRRERTANAVVYQRSLGGVCTLIR